MPWGVYVTLAAPVAIALAVLLFLIMRSKMPILKIIASPVEQSALRRAGDAENELALSLLTIDALTRERDDLVKERSLETVIALVNDVAGGVTTMLDKLSELNGSLTHTKEGLSQAVAAIQASTKAIEFLASQMITDFRTHPPTD